MEPHKIDLSDEDLRSITHGGNDDPLPEVIVSALGQVSRKLKGGIRFAILEGLRFQDIADPILRDQYILNVCKSMGLPRPTDQKNHTIIWPVQAKAGMNYNNSTYSEHPDRADMHTDTQYFFQPEVAMSLWCIHPSSDGGGESILVDGRRLVEDIVAEGRESLIDVLRESVFPFEVPSIFTKDEAEFFVGPIIGENPFIRYRRQTIDRARANPKYSLENRHLQAINELDTYLSQPSRHARFLLKRGQVLFVNNHEVLHGRTSFADLDRLLLRIRFDLHHELI